MLWRNWKKKSVEDVRAAILCLRQANIHFSLGKDKEIKEIESSFLKSMEASEKQSLITNYFT